MLDTIADYELERLLGKGGMGAVYLSHHPLLNIPLAIKILEPHNSLDEEEFQQRFIREGLLAASIEHHNLVRIYDAGADGPRNYLAMEYIDGPHLGKLVEQSPDGLDESFVREAALGICGALKIAHSKGIIHRDIKPENILMTPNGEAKLADLGIAKDEASELNVTATGIALGTPHYIAPEQALDAASADNRSDIYTLGATLYHLLCGTTPYEGKSPLEVMMKHVQEPLIHPIIRQPNINTDFANVIAKMMEKRPEMRYQNCDEVVEDLNKLKTGKSLVHLKSMYDQSPETKTKESHPPKRAKKRTVKKAPKPTTSPAKTIIAGIAVLIVLGLISLALIPSQEPEPTISKNSQTAINSPNDYQEPNNPTQLKQGLTHTNPENKNLDYRPKPRGEEPFYPNNNYNDNPPNNEKFISQPKPGVKEPFYPNDNYNENPPNNGDFLFQPKPGVKEPFYPNDNYNDNPPNNDNFSFQPKPVNNRNFRQSPENHPETFHQPNMPAENQVETFENLKKALRQLMKLNKLSRITENNFHIKHNMVHLDLSNQIYLKDISPLANINFRDLNLSGTSVENISVLRNVDHLNISNTDINLYDLKNTNIHVLELGIVDDFTPLKGLNISELKVMHYSGNDISPLKEIPNLRRLTITNGAPKVFPKTYLDIHGHKLRDLLEFGIMRKGQGGRFNGEGMRKGSFDEGPRRRLLPKSEQNFPR